MPRLKISVDPRQRKSQITSDLDTNEIPPAIRSKKRRLFVSPNSPNNTNADECNTSEEDGNGGAWDWDSELKNFFHSIQSDTKRVRKTKSKKIANIIDPVQQNMKNVSECFQFASTKIENLRSLHYQKYTDLINQLDKENENFCGQVDKMISTFEETRNLYIEYQENQKKRIEYLRELNSNFFQNMTIQNKQFKEDGCSSLAEMKKSLECLQRTIDKKSQTSELFKKSLMHALW